MRLKFAFNFCLILTPWFMKDSASEMIFDDPILADLWSAFNIRKVLDSGRIYKLKTLGYCPTIVQQFRDDYRLDDRDDTPTGSKRGIKDRDRAIQVCNPGSGIRCARIVYPLVIGHR